MGASKRVEHAAHWPLKRQEPTSYRKAPRAPRRARAQGAPHRRRRRLRPANSATCPRKRPPMPRAAPRAAARVRAHRRPPSAECARGAEAPARRRGHARDAHGTEPRGRQAGGKRTADEGEAIGRGRHATASRPWRGCGCAASWHHAPEACGCRWGALAGARRMGGGGADGILSNKHAQLRLASTPRSTFPIRVVPRCARRPPAELEALL